MSETKTLKQALDDAQKKAKEALGAADEARYEVSNAERALARQAEEFGALMNNPDFQQTLISVWKYFDGSRRRVGLGIDEFVKGCFTEFADGRLESMDFNRCADNCVPDACKYGRGTDCAMWHDPKMQVPATPETMAWVKAKAQDDESLTGLNSVARGQSEP